MLLIGALILVPTSATAKYKLQSGDTLEVSVMGLPDFRQRLAIDVDGEIVLPLVGQIKVSGLSVSEAITRIKHDLSNRIFSQQISIGREIQHLIRPNDIVVTVAEYRPIYVSGHVAKPGGYPFRSGMTVRQVIAIAGGYNLLPPGTADPFLQGADFRSQYEALWIEYAAVQYQISRLRTELGQDGGAHNPSDTVPISEKLRKRLKQTADAYLNARRKDQRTDRAAYQDAIKKADIQLDILAAKKKKDEEGNKADEDEFAQVRELFKRGITANSRLSETRRAALLSSDQYLQTVVQMSNVEQQRNEYARKMKKLDTQARINDWKELQQANLRLAQLSAQIKGMGEKLMYMGQLRSLTNETKPQFNISVYRKGENGLERIKANEDMQLAPGDVIEVTPENEKVSDLSAQ